MVKDRGPFPVILDNSPPSKNPPRRNHSCPNYEGCLSLAAALDWQSFSCLGCAGDPDVTLVWRAQLKRKDDPLASRFLREPAAIEKRKVG
jgi:hypothetical protein